MENNYSVYEHVTPDGLYYFGQSQNVEKRWSNNGARYKGTALYPYIEKYGWENIQHIVLFRDKTKEDALWIENFLIETAREDGVCINKNRSGYVSKEDDYQRDYYEKNREYKRDYYEKNREKYNEYKRDYYEKNREKYREKFNEYYEQNREKILEQQRDYYEKNREKLNEYQRDYYEQNREKRLEYQRQYYQRKKLEKQHKEVETTPLF